MSGCVRTCKTPVGCTCGKMARAREKAAAAQARGSVRIADMPVMAAIPPARSLDPQPRPASRPVARAPHRAPRRRLGFGRTVGGLLAGLAAWWMLVQLLASLAPGPVDRPVAPAQFDGDCGYYGPAVSARIVNVAGPYPIYHVVCANGGFPLPMELAR